MLFYTVPKSQYLIWWQIADLNLDMQKTSENMAKLICRASSLKSDDPLLRGASSFSRMCTNCDLGTEEYVQHMIMQCPFMEDIRRHMYESMGEHAFKFGDKLKEAPTDVFGILLGRISNDLDFQDACKGLEIAGRHICTMYKRIINARKGIG